MADSGMPVKTRDDEKTLLKRQYQERYAARFRMAAFAAMQRGAEKSERAKKRDNAR